MLAVLVLVVAGGHGVVVMMTTMIMLMMEEHQLTILLTNVCVVVMITQLYSSTTIEASTRLDNNLYTNDNDGLKETDERARWRQRLKLGSTPLQIMAALTVLSTLEIQIFFRTKINVIINGF